MEPLIFTGFILLWWKIDSATTNLATRQHRIEQKLERFEHKLDLILHRFDLSLDPKVRFQIALTLNAETDLIQLHTLNQLQKPQVIVEAIKAQLSRDADVQSKRRKLMIPETLKFWSLKIDKYRLFYILPSQTQVKIIAIGYRAHHDLFIRDKKKVTDLVRDFEWEQGELGKNDAFVTFLSERSQERNHKPLENIERETVML